MNEHEFMKVTNGMDGQYIAEYDSIRRTKRLNIKHLVRTAAVVAAAAVVAIPVGAYAYNTFIHHDNVSIYYTGEGAQKLEEKGLVSNRTIENGQIRLTVDTELCDGNFTSGLYTITALTEEAKEHIETAETRLVYADTGEELSTIGGAYEGWVSDAKSENELTREFQYPVKNAYIDSSRPLRLEFYEWRYTGESDGYGQIVEQDFGFYEGIYFDLLTEPNVPCKQLRSEAGVELTLDPYGVSTLSEDWQYPEEDGYNEDMNITSFVIISTDGERIELVDGEGCRMYAGSPESGNFLYNWYFIMEVENISGVEINGVAYMAE